MTDRLSGTTGHGLRQRNRIAGVDLARGLALLGMMAAHVFDADERSTVTTVAADWSVTTFALVVGVSLALMPGGKRAGRERAAVRAGLAVHAVLVAVIGLALGFTGRADTVLACIAVLVLLAIPLLGLRAWMLMRIAAVLLLVAPPMITATLAGAVPRPVDNPTFATLITDPSGLVIGLFLTGFYPVITYLAYICAGLAIGHMDLSSDRVAYRLLLGGFGTVAVGMLWLMLPLPHTQSWMVLIHDVHGVGAAIAVVGASLLVVRVPVPARLLWPIRTAGSMPLTLYSAHVLVLVSGVLEHEPAVTGWPGACARLTGATAGRRTAVRLCGPRVQRRRALTIEDRQGTGVVAAGWRPS